MKSLIFVLGATLGCAGVLSAEEESPLPRFEAGLTYSGVHLNAANNNSQITGNGGSGTFEYNINKWIGAVADLGGYANTRNGIDDKAFTYLFGPRLNWRHNRLTPYAQALFGGGYAWSGANSTTQNAFALAVGGGLDYRLTRRIAIKPVQVEYFRSQFDSPQLGGATSNFGSHQNGIRYSAGVVLMFGSR
jgi:peptidoglycan-associated lipoprotein